MLNSVTTVQFVIFLFVLFLLHKGEYTVHSSPDLIISFKFMIPNFFPTKQIDAISYVYMDIL